MYKVFYWLSDKLEMDNCGGNGVWAWELMKSYFAEPNYYPWLEYKKEVVRQEFGDCQYAEGRLNSRDKIVVV